MRAGIYEWQQECMERKEVSRPVDKLVEEHEVAGRELLLEGAARARCENVRAALLLQRPHVRAVVDVRRGDAVALPVTASMATYYCC